MVGFFFHLLFPSSPSYAHNPFGQSYLLAFLRTNPFCRPATHCSGKSDFPFSRGIKAQPSRHTRIHFLGLSADPRRPASLPSSRKMSQSLSILIYFPLLPCLFLYVCM
ncbi:hypothetical protein ATANTOWER_010143 [Ataeniobius toweri]|uniref:Uncharacterized protein n=1 Tax=Ataeniobius toweri TaxID=208326 RepID=A0ABU7BDB3_9TELE|nr:hypothetical protein [Ataeniobius toweri]